MNSQYSQFGMSIQKGKTNTAQIIIHKFYRTKSQAMRLLS